MFRKLSCLSAAVCVAVMFAASVSACRPRHAAKPPPDDPADPTLATISDHKITRDHLAYVIAALPETGLKEARTEDGLKEILETQIDLVAYAKEGRRRGLQNSPAFHEAMDVASKIILIDMAKDAVFRGLPEGADAAAFREALKERVAALSQEYEVTIHDDTLEKNPLDLEGSAPVIAGRAFDLEMNEFIEWIKTLPKPLRELVGSAPGRRYLGRLYLEQELWQLEAVANKRDKTPEFKTRRFVAETNLLGHITAEKITGTNVVATSVEAEAYYSDHPEEFDKPFAEAKEDARTRATERKRARVRKELAFALRRDRYPVRYREDAIAAFDVAAAIKRVGDAPDAPLVSAAVEGVDESELVLPILSPGG
ncbi:hypothetical protein K8I61_02230 [bacterium]|nr:hypothetical protein [bacterium]